MRLNQAVKPTPKALTRYMAHLVLRKREHECWHLHDFITPLGESLSYLYSAGQP